MKVFDEYYGELSPVKGGYYDLSLVDNNGVERLAYTFNVTWRYNKLLKMGSVGFIINDFEQLLEEFTNTDELKKSFKEWFSNKFSKKYVTRLNGGDGHRLVTFNRFNENKIMQEELYNIRTKTDLLRFKEKYPTL
jgi:hypothetical protein